MHHNTEGTISGMLGLILAKVSGLISANMIADWNMLGFLVNIFEAGLYAFIAAVVGTVATHWVKSKFKLKP